MMSMTIYTFHVADAVTGAPVAGAQCAISDVALGFSRLEGQGGLTDANGVCALDIIYFIPRYFSVYKAGYETARGSVPGTTINVQLQPIVGPVKYYVNINATGPATLNPAAGLYQVDANSTLPVTVTSIEAGYFLSRWRVDDVDVPASGNSISVKITHDSFSIYAVIESNYTIYIAPVAGVGGTTDPIGNFLVLPNSQMTVRAIPDSGYVLDHWIINGVPNGNANPITVTVDRNQFTVECVFKQQGQDNSSSLFIVLSRTTGVPGKITMDGLLTDSNGNAIDGVPVKLNINNQDKATFTTKVWYPYGIPRNIWFEHTFPEGAFDIYVYWLGNAAYLGCSGDLIRATYTTIAKIPTVISPFTATPATGPSPLDVSIAGLLKDNTGFALSAKSIDIYRNNTKIATGLTSMGGVFTYLDRVTAVGTYNYYAQFNGDNTYAGCNSQVLSVNVKEDQGEIPVDWDAPAEYKSGVYEWSLKFSITPIPFLSSWVANLQAGQQNDEANINAIMAERGATGTATILSKDVTMHANWYGAVDYFTIKYTVAFTGSIQPTIGASLFAFAVLIPFIPAILSIIGLIIYGLIIYNILSTLKEITGPDEYKPLKDGECASGWVWDETKKLCVKKGMPLDQLILLICGSWVAVTVLPKMLEGRGKKKS